MNIEELTKIWNTSNMDINQTATINKELLKNVTMSKVKSNLMEIKLSAIISLIVSWIFTQFLAQFIWTHFSTPKLLIPALVLAIFTLAEFAQSIYQLVLCYTLDSSAPVIENQKKLWRLRFIEQMEVKALLVLIPLFWTAFLIVIAWAFAGMDVLSMGPFILSQLGGSILIAVIVVYFLKKFPDKKLEEAIQFLAEIKKIEDS
jgi:hypothetical protein